MTERRAAAPAPASHPEEARGFRPASRRRARVAIGAALAAVAIGGNVLVYMSLDDRTEVLQVIRNVRAGEQITTADLRAVSVDLDATVPHVDADDIGLVAGQYSRVYIASGSLMVEQLVQPDPLVSPGTAAVAVEVTPTALPDGLRERSRVALVIEADEAPATTVEGRVVHRADDVDSVSGAFALTVEVAEADAPVVAEAQSEGIAVGVVLLDPDVDPVRATDTTTDATTDATTGTGETG